MLSRIAVFAVVVFSSIVVLRSASAQVVYEPVQYQYGSGHNLFYYGGSDPNVVRRGFWACGGYLLPYGKPVSLDMQQQMSNCDCGQGFYRAGIYERDNFDGGLPIRVYSDALPRRNAATAGFTASDARNEAYWNIPRYYRKADEMKTAYVDHTGAVIVPAIPIRDEDTQRVRLAGRELVGRGGIIIRPWDRDNDERPATTTSPSTMPTASRTESRKPVIIIPKDLLNRPLSSFKKNQVASAN
jgi:hypothetical protein